MIGLTITKVIEETPDTNTYVFETTGKEAFHYKAGQFITLMINRSGRELRRSYSLSTSPAYDDYTAFTVKRVQNGDVSRHLLLNLKKGIHVDSYGTRRSLYFRISYISAT